MKPAKTKLDRDIIASFRRAMGVTVEKNDDINSIIEKNLKRIDEAIKNADSPFYKSQFDTPSDYYSRYLFPDYSNIPINQILKRKQIEDKLTS